MTKSLKLLSKNLESTVTPKVDSTRVLDAAREKDAPDFYNKVKITGLKFKNVLGRDIPKFTTEITEGDETRTDELTGSSQEVERYNEELTRLKNESK